MILDAQLLFYDGTAVTVTANSANVIDLGAALRDIARSSAPMRVRLQVGTAFTASGAGTAQFQLVESAAENLGTPTVLFDTGAVGKATLVAGYTIMDIVLPKTAKRYLGIVCTVATGPMLTGTVTGGLLQNTETDVRYGLGRPNGNIGINLV